MITTLILFLSRIRFFLNKKFSLLFTFVLLTSCSIDSNNNIETNKPLVLTTFTVLADISRNVAGDRLHVKSITKEGAEIHGYKPTPSDLILASKADLIVENGLGLELWSKKFTNAAGNIPKIVLSEGITPLLIEGDVYKGKPNPHIWMSPKKAIYYLDKLVEAFSDIDPEGSNTFEENARIYKTKLINLDHQLRESISKIPDKNRVLVTCEGAFSYLANDYGLKEAYLWPVNSESQVTPKRMLKLIKTIKKHQVPTIFCESTVNAKAQLEVARSSGASFGGTFYVDSLSDKNGPAPTYLELLSHNVQLIMEGLLIEKTIN